MLVATSLLRRWWYKIHMYECVCVWTYVVVGKFVVCHLLCIQMSINDWRYFFTAKAVTSSCRYICDFVEILNFVNGNCCWRTLWASNLYWWQLLLENGGTLSYYLSCLQTLGGFVWVCFWFMWVMRSEDLKLPVDGRPQLNNWLLFCNFRYCSELYAKPWLSAW